MKWILIFCILELLLVKSHPFLDPNDLYRNIPEAESDLTAPFFDQPWTYISQGEQMIVFASNDGAYVLKIFKGRQKLPFKFSRVIGRLIHQEAARIEWKAKFAKACRSYQIALEHLQDETGLILLHFEKTKTPLPVTLIDKTAYRLDINQLPFIIQKRAVLAPTYFQDNPAKKQEATQALKDFFVRRLEKGFSDPRQTLTKNFGFIGDTPVQLDVGKIEPFIGDREAELAKIHAHIDAWSSRF